MDHLKYLLSILINNLRSKLLKFSFEIRFILFLDSISLISLESAIIDKDFFKQKMIYNYTSSPYITFYIIGSFFKISSDIDKIL